MGDGGWMDVLFPSLIYKYKQRLRWMSVFFKTELNHKTLHCNVIRTTIHTSQDKTLQCWVPGGQIILLVFDYITSKTQVSCVLLDLTYFEIKLQSCRTSKSNKPKWKSDETAMIKWTDYKSQRVVIKWTHNKMTIRKMIAINQTQKQSGDKFVKVSWVICRKWRESGCFSRRNWALLWRLCGIHVSFVKHVIEGLPP